jgi:hypothetical protein
MRWSLLCGAAGFFFVALLSLLAGNLWGTSLIRGVIGFLVLAGAGTVAKGVWDSLIEPEGIGTGTRIDLTLPPEKPQSHRPQVDEESFVPMTFARLSSHAADLDDEQARKMAEALRQWKD